MADNGAGSNSIIASRRAEAFPRLSTDEIDRLRRFGEIRRYEEPVRHLFLFLGAEPATEWLADCAVALQRGFVATGAVLSAEDLGEHPCWRMRQPAPLETSVPGVFAIGDVRAGSVKRVGAAIGEGAAVVAQLHAHLAAQNR